MSTSSLFIWSDFIQSDKQYQCNLSCKHYADKSTFHWKITDAYIFKFKTEFSIRHWHANLTCRQHRLTNQELTQIPDSFLQSSEISFLSFTALESKLVYSWLCELMMKAYPYRNCQTKPGQNLRRKFLPKQTFLIISNNYFFCFIILLQDKRKHIFKTSTLITSYSVT